MTDRERDTEPSNLKPTHESILEYLVCAVDRIESQLAQDPPWVAKLFDGILNLTARVEKLESEVSRIKTVCSYHHGNGKSLPPIGK